VLSLPLAVMFIAEYAVRSGIASSVPFVLAELEEVEEALAQDSVVEPEVVEAEEVVVCSMDVAAELVVEVVLVVSSDVVEVVGVRLDELLVADDPGDTTMK
jgi:hypothetical protein